MNEHIAKTIEDLTARRDKLDGLIGALRDLDTHSIPTPTARAGSRACAPARNGVPKPVSRNGHSHSRVNMDGVRTPLVLVLAEPFGRIDVQTALDVTDKAASGILTRWTARGWLKKTGYKHYARTAKFPGHKGTPRAVTPAAAPSGSRAQIEKALAEACKQRDHARNNGRDTMVEIFQKDIDALEAQLEAITA